MKLIIKNKKKEFIKNNELQIMFKIIKYIIIIIIQIFI